ncbi:MAG TPA: hypothetical protein PLX32_15235, partial [Niabella sp.]|nr:hypothetical protein [Niabella sp.]
KGIKDESQNTLWNDRSCGGWFFKLSAAYNFIHYKTLNADIGINAANVVKEALKVPQWVIGTVLNFSIRNVMIQRRQLSNPCNKGLVACL